MNVNIKRIDTSLPLPEYKTEGAVAFDIYAREDTSIPGKELTRIPTNLIVQVPAGYLLLIKDRSSTAGKGLLATAGIIDQDYHGPEDEILFQVYNYTDKQIDIKRGERVAQGMFIRIEHAKWNEPEGNLKDDSRSGFGSTGS